MRQALTFYKCNKSFGNVVIFVSQSTDFHEVQLLLLCKLLGFLSGNFSFFFKIGLITY